MHFLHAACKPGCILHDGIQESPWQSHVCLGQCRFPRVDVQSEPEPSPGVKHVVCEGRLSSRERFGGREFGGEQNP